uniref:Putative ovule protein n=1 Tax=Solanum chacoense TaxID=4108 RepID=A0A0V0GVX8_SOLCH
MHIFTHELCKRFTHWPYKGWMISLICLGQSSPLELAFGVELGPRSISLQAVLKRATLCNKYLT